MVYLAKMKQEHTALPWRSMEMGSEGARILPDTDDKREALKHIARVDGRDALTDFANAEYIVRACNNFEGLLAAAKAVFGYMACGKTIGLATHDRLDAAIKKAEEKE